MRRNRTRVALALVLVVFALACRRRERSEVAAIPSSERTDALIAAAGETHELDVDVREDDALVPDIDPCAQWGPSPGEPCTEAGVICLSIYDVHGTTETKCDGTTWKSAPARWPKPGKGACPAKEPVLGAPCTGAFECPFGSCSWTDPETGASAGPPAAWYPVWVCYKGGFRRYDVRCIGE